MCTRTYRFENQWSVGCRGAVSGTVHKVNRGYEMRLCDRAKLAPGLGHANHYRCGCALNVGRDERNLEQLPQSCSCEAAARASWWTMGELAINWNSSGCIATHIGGWFTRDAVAAYG